MANTNKTQGGKPLLSIVSPTYNEEDNILELFRRIKSTIEVFIDRYSFEIIFIDNHSTDSTPKLLRSLASCNPDVKIILNTRNFGHIRSPYYGLLQAKGRAAIYMASDLQDPPERIVDFISHWEEGYKLVMATKPKSQGPRLMHSLRRLYYRVLDGLADIEILQDSTGFGLYDAVVLDELRKISDPYPFLRGLICELGWEIKTIPFEQPRRLRGVTKNNLYTLYDIGILGVVSHSKIPIRLASAVGFLTGLFSLLVAFVFMVLKLVFWDSFPLGIAPIVIGVFFMFGLLMIFIGLLGGIHSFDTLLRSKPTYRH